MKTKLQPLVIFLRLGIHLIIVLPYTGISQVKFSRSLKADLIAFETGRTDFVDIDGDGDQDLFIVGEERYGIGQFAKLYLNDGSGAFSEKLGTNFPLVPHQGSTVFVDYDGDGDQDMFLSGRIDRLGGGSAHLFENDGSGNLAEVEVPGLKDLINGSVVFSDLDGNGTLDLLIAGTSPIDNLTYIQLFSNSGNGVFTEIPNDFNIGIFPRFLIEDFNNDGKQDVLLLSVNKKGQLYLNEGDFNFRSEIKENIDVLIGLAVLESSDFDGDGDMDVFVGLKGSRAARFYMNDGSGNFSSVPPPIELESFSIVSVNFFDIDNDGDEDLQVTGLATNLGVYNYLYTNNGPGTFVFVSGANFFGGYGNSAIADVDNDGWPDILVAGGKNYKQAEKSSDLYLNKTVNRLPVITNLEIEGEPIVGETLKSVYDFCDADGHPDKTSYTWRRALPNNSSRWIVSTERNLTLTPDLVGNYIELSVWERDGIGVGRNFTTALFGPVQAAASKLSVFGNNQIVENEAVSSSDNHTSFGAVPVSVTVSREFQIKNMGNIDLTIEDLRVFGEHEEDFTIAGPILFSIEPGQAASFFLEFTPTGIGERTAAILFNTNDPNQAIFNMNISGEGSNNVPIFITEAEIVVSEGPEVPLIDIDATDGEGDEADQNVTYTISGGEDATLFTIGNSGLLEFITPPDFENPGDLDGDNIYLIEISATDEFNLVSTKGFSIRITDFDEAPVVVCIEEIELLLDENGAAQLNVEQVDNGSWDDSGALNLILSKTNFTCSDVGTHQVNLIGESGSKTSSCTVLVTIIDTENPTIQAIADIEVDNDEGQATAVISIEKPEVTDNCGLPVLLGERSDGAALEDSYPVGETIIIWSVSDSNGNKGQDFQQKVNVKDVEKPVFASVEDILQSTQAGGCTVNIEIAFPIANDNMGKVQITGSRQDGRDLTEAFSIGTTVITWTATDDSRNSTQAIQKIIVVDNEVPVFSTVEELRFPPDSGGCSASFEITPPTAVDNCRVVSISGSRQDGKDLSDAYLVGNTEITWTATDASGNTSQVIQKVTITDTENPVFDIVETIELSSDSSGCGARIAIIPPSATDNCSGVSVSGSRQDGKGLNETFSIGITEITWTATDVSGNKTEVIQEVVVTNAAPASVLISGPQTPLPLGEEVRLTASFSDENIASATWKAFDGINTFGPYAGNLSSGTASYTFSNLSAGVYTIILELVDFCGAMVVENFEYVVIFDPNGGFVTGGGWINSPIGALRGSDATGKANFGFNAKYKNGKTILGDVDGNTSFQFRAGDIDFKSSSHENMSLVISGGFKATYKGMGRVNGADGYKFLVTVIDAEQTDNLTEDYFRIKIWNGAGVLYDNNLADNADNANPATSIGGGSIVIHRPKQSEKGQVGVVNPDIPEIPDGLILFTAYPNPVEERAEIAFQLDQSTEVRLTLYDMNGKEVLQLFSGRTIKEVRYTIPLIKGQLMQGLYICRLSTSTGRFYQKQVLIN